MASLLSSDERLAIGTDLAQWSMAANRDAITRSYQFKDFKEACAFMTQSPCVRGTRNEIVRSRHAKLAIFISRCFCFHRLSPPTSYFMGFG